MRHVGGAVDPPNGDYDADIVILSLGRLDETMAAISSAAGQTGLRHHVTVIDQGSSPDSLGRLSAFVEAMPGTTLLATERNLGVAAGRNRATAFGHGRTIIALDNDAVFSCAETAQAAVAALDCTKDLAAIGFRILVANTGADDLLCWGYPRSLLAARGRCFEAATFVGAGHAIRRAAWESVGGYDEVLFFCWEELDFALRAIRQGWRIEYRGDIAIRHMTASGRRMNWQNGRWFYFVRNRVYLERKHGAAWRSVLALAAGYWVKGARNGLWGDSFRGLCQAAALMSQLRPVAGKSEPVRDYLERADAVHRQAVWRRAGAEALARLPG